MSKSFYRTLSRTSERRRSRFVGGAGKKAWSADTPPLLVWRVFLSYGLSSWNTESAVRIVWVFFLFCFSFVVIFLRALGHYRVNTHPWNQIVAKHQNVCSTSQKAVQGPRSRWGGRMSCPLLSYSSHNTQFYQLTGYKESFLSGVKHNTCINYANVKAS